jgi:hypothetical protein
MTPSQTLFNIPTWTINNCHIYSLHLCIELILIQVLSHSFYIVYRKNVQDKTSQSEEEKRCGGRRGGGRSRLKRESHSYAAGCGD